MFFLKKETKKKKKRRRRRRKKQNKDSIIFYSRQFCILQDWKALGLLKLFAVIGEFAGVGGFTR